MNDYWKQQEADRLAKLEKFVRKSCDIAFEDKIKKVESLGSRVHGGGFDAFEITFRGNLDNGIDGDDFKTFLECFNPPKSSGFILDYTVYANDSRLVIVIAVQRYAN